jgi:hypothetical protein
MLNIEQLLKISETSDMNETREVNGMIINSGQRV